MKRKLVATVGVAGGATLLLLALIAGPVAADGNSAFGTCAMDRDRDQLQVRDGSCDATLGADADRDLIRLQDRDRLEVNAADTGNQEPDRDRDQLQVRDGSCDATLAADADRDLIRLQDRDRLEVNAADTGNQEPDQDRTRDRDRLQDADCVPPCDGEGAQLGNREQGLTAGAQIATQAQTQERVRAGR